ncbi:MAG: T9SS type A sorting domain-containing protein [Flavobacteriales bacterium]|nr:T9SS type A sorting domain-containing protein [Flavobacteriales bacterium]
MKNTILLYSFILAGFISKAQDHSNISYGTETRQFLDIYLGISACPTPVYFHAHFNGGTTAMPSSITDSMTYNGISVVSWESLTTITTAADIQTGWNDAELMFNWVKSNASTYNFDTTNFIIGGSSRGSILSWKEAHKIDPDIKGLYMYNALPTNAWADSTIWYPPNDVNPKSPPIFFVYNREPGCSSDPINPDIHDPNNGIIIQNRYDFLGIGDRDTLIHSISDSTNTDRFQYLVDFANSVITPCWTAGIESNNVNSKRIQVFPNPFKNQLKFSGLIGNEKITLQNTIGQILMNNVKPEELNISSLNSGIYILIIESDINKQTIKLTKE